MDPSKQFEKVKSVEKKDWKDQVLTFLSKKDSKFLQLQEQEKEGVPPSKCTDIEKIEDGSFKLSSESDSFGPSGDSVLKDIKDVKNFLENNFGINMNILKIDTKDDTMVVEYK